MTVAWNSYAGLAVGTTLTAANSGGVSGTAFDTVTTGSGGTQVADNTHLPSGPYALKIQATTAAATFSQWLASFSFATTFFRRYFYFTANPGATIRLFNITDASSVMSVSLNSTGHLVVTFGSGGTNFVTFTNAIPLNAPFRIEGFCIESATVGQVSLTLYPGESTTATETHTSAATLNTGTFSAPKSSWDDSNTLGTIGPYWVASPALSSTNLLGPALYISTTSLPAATAGTVYGSTLATTGGTGAVTWSLFSGSLPPGLTLSSGGVISGTPTTTGGFGFVVQAADANGNVFRQSLTIPVAGSGGGGPSPILQPPAGFAWFGAYPAPSSGRPASYESGVLGGTRQLAFFTRYYQVQSTMLATDAIDVAAGRFLVMNLAPSFTVSGTSAAITYADITAGTYDTNLISIATTLAGYASPVIVLWAHEMETSALAGYGTAAQFIASFQHVANLFRATAPGRIIMGWGTSGIHAGAYYPGDAFVDWIWVDPYDPTLSNGAGEPSTGPALTFRPFMTWLQAQSFGAGKPVGLFETGVQAPSSSNSNTDPNVATWISGIAAEMATLGYQAFNWFNAGGTLGSDQIPPGSLSAAAMSAQGQLAFFNPPVIAPASVAYQIGSNSTNDTVTTVSIIATVPTGTNDGIVVGASINSGSALPLSCADDAGNTYVLQGNSIDTSIGCVMFVTTGTTTPLTAGQKITVTFPAAAATGKTVMACGVPGMFTSSAVDVAVKADDTTGTNSTPAASTGTLAQSTEMMVACEFSTHTGLAIDWNSPLSPVVNGFQALGGNQWAAMGAGLTSSTAPVNAGGTITAAKWVLLAVSLKVAALPFITTGSLPDAFTGVSYTQGLTAVSGALPYTWSVSSGSLPAGFSLNASTGVISGSSAVTESATFTVEVTDANSNTDTQVLTLAVASNLAVTTPSLLAGVTGAAYSQTLAATGGTLPYTWAVTSGSLPAGLALNASTGVISGTPETAGSSSFTVTATDAASNTDGQPLSIAVTSNLAVTTTSVPAGIVGVAYSFSVAAAGGFGAYTWSHTGTLPTGLSLSAGGILSGTPSAASSPSITFTVTDAGGNTASVTLPVVVSAALSVTTTTLPPGTAGTAYTATLTAAAGTSPYTWAVTAGALPPGLSLASSTGVISGTPTIAGFAAFTVTVTDHVAATASALLAIIVAPAPVPPFPAGPLDLRVELLLSGIWTDISQYAEEDNIAITRGHPDESTTASPSTLALTLNNTDGRFSSKNPSGPYYQSLKRNVQCRVSLPDTGSYLRLENDQASYASGPALGMPSGTSDSDIQIEASLYWTGNGTNAVLASKWQSAGNQRSWILFVNDDGTLTFTWSPDGTFGSALSATSTIPVTQPPGNGRQGIRVTFVWGSGVVTFWTAPAGPLSSATWTQLGAAAGPGSSTTLFGSAVVTELGWCSRDSDFSKPGVNGKIHAFRWLLGVAGAEKTGPDFTTLIPGIPSFTDSESNGWVLQGTSEISNRKYRVHCEIPAWPQNQDSSGKTVKVTVSGGGLLRRTGVAQTPARSAMERAYIRLPASLQLVAYWPAEDGTNATQIASGIATGTPMSISGTPGVPSPPAGTPQLGQNSDFQCSDALPVMNGGTFTGAVTSSGVTWTDNVIRFLLEVPSGGDTNGALIARAYTSGTVRRLDLVYGSTGTLALAGYDAGGSQLFNTTGVAFNVNGQLLRVSMALRTSGSNVEYEIQTLTAGGSGETFGNTLTSASIGAVTRVQFGNLTQSVMGHFSVQAVWDSLFDLDDFQLPDGSLTGPLSAWQGEPAGLRFSRLCAEEGFQFRGRGPLQATAAMGTQTLQTITALLQECVDADLGIMWELRQQLGFGYRTVAATGNQFAAVTLSYNADHLDIPTSPPLEDDQTTINDVTVTQTSDGSSARATDTTSALSVNPPPAGIGRYDQQYQVNLAQDSQLGDNAGWRLHMGTVDEPRYPGIGCDLANAAIGATLQAQILDMDIGDRLSITNAPAWLPPGTIDQVINGYTETLGMARTLTESWQGIPYHAWSAGYVGGDEEGFYGWADTDGSHLHAAATATATTIQVTTEGSFPLWTTSGGDMPFAVLVAGELMTVTAISGTSNPQTFTVTRSVNGVVKAQAASTQLSLAFPAVAGM